MLRRKSVFCWVCALLCPPPPLGSITIPPAHTPPRMFRALCCASTSIYGSGAGGRCFKMCLVLLFSWVFVGGSVKSLKFILTLLLLYIRIFKLPLEAEEEAGGHCCSGYETEIACTCVLFNQLCFGWFLSRPFGRSAKIYNILAWCSRLAAHASVRLFVCGRSQRSL